MHDAVGFDIPPGGMTAYAGPSDAGNTTVFSPIKRFHEPDSGQMLPDGRDVRDRNLAELRATIGDTDQDAPVLSGSLRDNLLFSAPETSDDELCAVPATDQLLVTD